MTFKLTFVKKLGNTTTIKVFRITAHEDADTKFMAKKCYQDHSNELKGYQTCTITREPNRGDARFTNAGMRMCSRPGVTRANVNKKNKQAPRYAAAFFSK